MVADYNRREYDSLEYICDWMPYFTHHSDMDAPQYVHVDVPSDSLCPWTFYYTYHSHMDATQYVLVDEQSRVDMRLNVLLHISQQYGCSPVCTR